MIRLHLLSPGFASPNGRAFLFPLVVWRDVLREHGLEWARFERTESELYDCDIVGIDARQFSPRWATQSQRVLEELAEIRGRTRRLIWFDITDSSGSDHFRPISLVDLYVKNQLLRERESYLKPIYGAGRIWCDYYHRKHGVCDSAPTWSEPVARREDLEKLRVGWNSGLADYSHYGPLRMAIYQRLSMGAMLRFPREFADPDQKRSIDVACRFGTRYARASVAWQRQEIAARARDRFATTKLGRRAYLAEMRHAKLVVSPFGFGEITLKDFEAFRAGALLLKPDMSHLETWPDLFLAGETIATHAWDLDDFDRQIAEALGDESRRRRIALQGQDVYRDHTTNRDAPARFATRLMRLISGSRS